METLQEKYQTITLEKACFEPIHRGEQPEYDETGDISVIKTVDVKEANIDYKNCLKVSEDFFNRFPSAHLKKNDVIITSTGLVSMGKVAVHTKNEPTVVDGHVSIIRLTKEYDPYFVTYFLLSHLGQLQFEKWFSGSSGQIEIQPQDLKKFILPSCKKNGIPLEKQIEIATEVTKKLEISQKLKDKAKNKWKEAELLFERLIYQ